MTRVEWSVSGERRFETGIDRGMFYPAQGAGVAWNGLTRVSEVPSGGTPKEMFLDGEKVLSLFALEEFAATIEGFSVPQEFVPCVGLKRLSVGLFAANQPRVAFGFSYRTLTGDDLQGLEAGYKVHVVYNALSKTSDFVNTSISERTDVQTRSWDITTIPEIYAGFKPVAHFVLDSRKVDPSDLATIEDILYGTDLEDPRLLSSSELAAILYGTGSWFSVATGIFALKKMQVSGQILAADNLSFVMGGVTRKKMRIAGSAAGIAVVTSAVRMKKKSASGYGGPGVTPFKIGSAFGNTGALNRPMPVSAATAAGDTIVLACATNVKTNYPTSAFDSKGNLYTLDRQMLSSLPTMTTFRSAGGSGSSFPTGMGVTTSDSVPLEYGFTQYDYTSVYNFWAAHTARPVDAIKLFNNPGVFPTTITTAKWQGAVATGARIWMCYQPDYNLSSAHRTSLVASLNALKALGMNIVGVILFQEVNRFSYCPNAIAYRNSVNYYGPSIVAAGFKLGHCSAGSNSVNWAACFHNGSGYTPAFTPGLISFMGADYYGQTWTFARDRHAGMRFLDEPGDANNIITIADSYPSPLPVGLLEMANSSDGSIVAQSDVIDYVHYHRDLLVARRAAGKPTMDSLWFNGQHLEPNVISSPTDFRWDLIKDFAAATVAPATTLPLTTSDTITIVMNSTSGLLSTFAVDLPGSLVGDYDVIPAAISAATSATPSASATPTVDNDVALALFSSSIDGGTPVLNAPFTSLGSQPGGDTGPYTAASYRLLGTGTAGNAQTATETIVPAGWKTIQYLFKRVSL